MDFLAHQMQVGVVLSLHRGFFAKAFIPELFFIMRSPVHGKVCLHVINTWLRAWGKGPKT